MKPQETKFTFVYNEIKQCILEGQIPPGNPLPSSRMYCEQFHVSRYTINRVFDALRAEGLIFSLVLHQLLLQKKILVIHQILFSRF